jgi:hypothetical protein
MRPKGKPDLEMCFRIEIFKRLEESNAYFPVVWVEEYFRMRPTFPFRHGKPVSELSDELLLCQEVSLGWDEIECQQPLEVLKKVKQKIVELCDEVPSD